MEKVQNFLDNLKNEDDLKNEDNLRLQYDLCRPSYNDTKYATSLYQLQPLAEYNMR